MLRLDKYITWDILTKMGAHDAPDHEIFQGTKACKNWASYAACNATLADDCVCIASKLRQTGQASKLPMVMPVLTPTCHSPIVIKENVGKGVRQWDEEMTADEEGNSEQ